jgi:4-amino-4-deoxy-L-arabinose transferase-like glycosyltransferase
MQNTVFQDAFEAGSFRVPLSWVLAGVLVGLLAAFIYFPPALVNEAPFHDDKAYINNALIASGRIRPEDAIGPYAEERPPLFWWLLTGLFILGAPNDSVRWASPLATTLGVVGIYFSGSKTLQRLQGWTPSRHIHIGVRFLHINHILYTHG